MVDDFREGRTEGGGGGEKREKHSWEGMEGHGAMLTIFSNPTVHGEAASDVAEMESGRETAGEEEEGTPGGSDGGTDRRGVGEMESPSSSRLNSDGGEKRLRILLLPTCMVAAVEEEDLLSPPSPPTGEEASSPGVFFVFILCFFFFIFCEGPAARCNKGIDIDNTDEDTEEEKKNEDEEVDKFVVVVVGVRMSPLPPPIRCAWRCDNDEAAEGGVGANRVEAGPIAVGRIPVGKAVYNGEDNEVDGDDSELLVRLVAGVECAVRSTPRPAFVERGWVRRGMDAEGIP